MLTFLKLKSNSTYNSSIQLDHKISTIPLSCPILKLYIQNFLFKGLNDWKNIQDVIRSTFMTMNDVIMKQSLEIQDLKKDRLNFVTREEVYMISDVLYNSY